MISTKLFEVLGFIYKSEKTIRLLNKNNILTLKVNYKSNKIEIKKAINKIFGICPIKINIINVKEKVKKFKNKFGKRKKWKKAYIYFKKDKFNLINLEKINNMLQ